MGIVVMLVEYLHTTNSEFKTFYGQTKGLHRWDLLQQEPVKWHNLTCDRCINSCDYLSVIARRWKSMATCGIYSGLNKNNICCNYVREESFFC